MLAGPGIASLNLLSLCLLLLCLRYGIGRERRAVFVWKEGYCASTSGGLSFMNLENFISRHAWNQLITLGGFILGGTTFLAFRLHERHLRDVAKRRCAEAARWGRIHRDTLPGKKPTRASRAAAEGHIPLDSNTIFGLVGSSLLTSLAATAALGVHLRPFSIGTPIPEYHTHKDSWVSSADMGALVYRSAHLRAAGVSGDGSTNLAVDFDRPRIGCCLYPNLRTRGVGVDPASALRTTDLRLMSPGLTIDAIQGVAIGTNMSAACKDESATWRREETGSACMLTRITDDHGSSPSVLRPVIVPYDGRRVRWLYTLLDDDGEHLRQVFV